MCCCSVFFIDEEKGDGRASHAPGFNVRVVRGRGGGEVLCELRFQRFLLRRLRGRLVQQPLEVLEG